MKVAQLRELLAGYDADTLRVLAVELYKAIPVALKREKELDRLMEDPEGWRAERKPARRRRTIDAGLVCDDAELFLENAREGNYFKPNLMVSKKERPKWRFVAKRLYRDLQAAALDEEWGEDAVDLLGQLFEVLCLGEEIYLFPSTTPFETIKVPKEEFYRTMLALDRRRGDPAAHVAFAFDMLVSASEVWGPPTEMVAALLEHLATPDMKELAVQEADRRLRELAGGKTGKQRPDGSKPSRRAVAAAMGEVAVRACIALAEPDRAATLARRAKRWMDSFAWDRLVKVLEEANIGGFERRR